MENLTTLVDWSRLQFALTAIYHWLFVPLTLGLSVIVAVMESIYLRTRSEKWLATTKFWMTCLAINFAIGVATGLILEFEFGTNWSNYSWFVGDIFGAPLAIEGIIAFFLEATFGAVMFFGWNKVSPRFHLAATWLTAIGASISAFWILVANAWMQYPTGMTFDIDQVRNVMTDFWALFSPVALNKFFHAVFSGWALSGIFVIGVSSWFLYKKRNQQMAISSIKTGGWLGLIGLLLCMYTGDGSAVEVARTQPMKLAAMEGLYKGECGQPLVAVGLLNPDKLPGDSLTDPYLFEVSIPKGLSILAYHDPDMFVAGIDDLIEGRQLDAEGIPVEAVSYAERIKRGKNAQAMLREYSVAKQAGDAGAMAKAEKAFRADYPYFGYGYFSSASQAVPPVALTFYSFRVMVILGSFFLLLYIVVLWLVYKKEGYFEKAKWLQWVAIISVPLMWVCSEAGWVVAEVGRQPWTVQDLLPVGAAISDVPVGSVITTFWIFAGVFTLLLIAEVGIMLRWIGGYSSNKSVTK
ncbi:MAG: cytochrome ubiquinol oxidase subunit I [Muribaculaceae bacterium]|nr:cytochrome ubiquinol oxidase subunit I [Muribaculaceae bacterium]